MKSFRTIMTIILVALLGLSWFSQISGALKTGKAYNAFIQNGDEFYSKGLYQKAIEEYKQAIAIKNSSEMNEKMLEAYEKAFGEGTITKNDYANVLLGMCNAEPKNVENWKRILEFYINCNDYTAAYTIVGKCRVNKLEDTELEILMNKVSYVYTIKTRVFSEVYMSSNGYYTVHYDDKWGVLDSAGEYLYECEYEFISPMNEDGTALLVSGLGNRIVDKNGIVQAIVSEKFPKVNAYSDGLLPVQKKDGVWQYYSSSEDKYVMQEYEYASSFKGGKAFVKENAEWKMINTKGEVVSEEIFDDVKCLKDGTYVCSNIMIASKGGSYHIYENNEMVETDVVMRDTDVYLGDYIAYQDANGKWGYVNKKGEVVIKPQFEKAKSFANGLAAVCENDLWGFINKKGDVVIDYQFLEVEYFTKDGICLVSSTEGLYQMIQLKFN